MPIRKLTARGVETLQPDPETFLELWDTDVPGFGIRVSPAGLKTWFVRYRHAGRRRRMKIGTFPALSLGKARERARKELAQAELGKDPAAVKAEGRTAPTFRKLAEKYLELHAPKKRSFREDRRILTKELLPKWGGTQAKEIRRADVIELLDVIAERPAPIMANRTLALARKVYNFGIKRGIVEANPCALVERPGEEKRRDRVLSDTEIATLWRELDATEKRKGRKRPVRICPEDAAAVFRLRLLTAQRGGEVLGMRWDELDLGATWWTIPAERSKNKLPHRVAVAPPVLRILEERERAAKGSPWVFPGHGTDGPLVNVQKALERVRERCGFGFRGHDLRRTAASHMTSMGVSRLVVGRILNHHEPGVTATYDRHSYDVEKRHALELWARRVEEIIAGEGATVVPMVRS